MTRIILVDFVQQKENYSNIPNQKVINSSSSLKQCNQHLFDDRELFQLLCSRMRSLSAIGFRYVGTIGDGLISCPWCVTVSHSSQLILVGDYYNGRILGFNLLTRILEETIQLLSGQPLSLCVEKGEERDALIVGTSMNQVLKLKIRKGTKSGHTYWKYISVGYPTGLCVSYRNNSNIILVCDTSSESVIMLNSKDGTEVNRIGNIQLENNNPFRKPFAIDFDDSTKSLYVSDMNGHCLRIVKFKKSITSNNLEYSQKSFGKGGSSFCNLKLPRGISLSKKKGLIFVADESNHRVQLFDCKREEFVNSFGTFGVTNSQFRKPYGVYFDDASETLLVADTYNNRVQLYR